MFFIYLRRELRRRMRQVIFISLGLAVGIGLVITVTAASAGVAQAQGAVLHSLYGVGTDITVTKAPGGWLRRPVRLPGPGARRRRHRHGTRPAPGTKFSRSVLLNRALGPISSTSVTSISGLHGVAAAGGALALTDLSISGTVPNAIGGGGGGGFGGGGTAPVVAAVAAGSRRRFSTNTFTVNGTQISAGEVGPLSSGKLTSGRTFASADATSNVAVIDSGYAKQNKLTHRLEDHRRRDPLQGDRDRQAAAGRQPGQRLHPAGPRAGAGQHEEPGEHDLRGGQQRHEDHHRVQGDHRDVSPKATVTTSSDLASEVTGSLSSASSLARNLGKWLAIAVLVAAFLLASLLTMSAVSRRVREFGTLKALGWRSRRIVGQVLGESITIGIIGGAGRGRARLRRGGAGVQARPAADRSVGLTTGSATPGGARDLRGGGRPAAVGGGVRRWRRCRWRLAGSGRAGRGRDHTRSPSTSTRRSRSARSCSPWCWPSPAA